MSSTNTPGIVALNSFLVVAFRMAVLRALEDGGGIVLLEQRTAASLAEAVLRISEDSERLRKLGELARQNVEDRFSLHASVRKLEKIYLSALRCARNSGLECV